MTATNTTTSTQATWEHNGRSIHHKTDKALKTDFSGKNALLSQHFQHLTDSPHIPDLNRMFKTAFGKSRRGTRSEKLSVSEVLVLSLQYNIITDTDHHLHCYIIAHDTGLAPATQDGTLSLAVCMPAIRKKAQVGDVVIAYAPGNKMSDSRGRVRYVFRVDEKMTMEEYMGEEPTRPDQIYSIFDEEAYVHKLEQQEAETNNNNNNKVKAKV